jgi:hypothetical protein
MLIFMVSSVNSQNLFEKTIATTNQSYTFASAVKLIENNTGLKCNYPYSYKNEHKKIFLGKQSYRLDVLLDKIALQLDIDYELDQNNLSFVTDAKNKYTISGYIRDNTNGEDLIGATCYVKGLKIGTASNTYGFYSITLPKGQHELIFSFIGNQAVSKKIDLQKDIVLNVNLEPEAEQITEVVVTGKSSNQNVEKAEMSVVNLPTSIIKKLPALMGEADLIKTVQMLPGVKPASEGSSGFSVRGGNPDQNLLLLDEAPVYNASHLLGFFSVFNNDAISDLKLYKGDIPANFGGRLSSILDIKMKNGNAKKFSMQGGLGTISSRLTLEGPIGEKTSFIVSGRRSYMDLFLRMSSNEDVKDNIVYFYDLNAKITHRFNDRNRLFVSSYLGRDVFKSKDMGFDFGNQTFSLRWNHLFNNKLFCNTTALFSTYNYELNSDDASTGFVWDSKMQDKSLKLDFTYFLNTNNTVKFGASTIYHSFDPGNARAKGAKSFISEYKVPGSNALENAAYITNEQKIGSRLTLKYGIRFSNFNHMGSTTVYHFDEKYNLVDSSKYKKGEVIKTYSDWEPRLGLKFTINEKSSAKLSYSKTTQYMQLSQNSTGGMPLDVWFPASKNIKPQYANQYALGYFRNVFDNKLELSFETYYKKMKNTIDFKDFASLLLNKQIEGEVRVGESEAYGFEFMANLNLKKLQGWIGYTYSDASRTIADINNGKKYNSPYDITHNVKATLSYDINELVNLSANFTYSTGAPATYPVARGIYHGENIKVYSDRNSYRMEDNHRLDLGLTIKSKKNKTRRYKTEWNFSVYNIYGRKNPWAISFKEEDDNPNVIYAEKTYLFTFVPSITFNFKY